MTSELAGARGRLETADGPIDLYRLDAIGVDLSRLPKTVLILLENLLRRAGSRDVSDEDVRALAAWPGPAGDVAFMPGRVLMQDFTGVPAVVDLAAMRSATQRAGADPASINPSIPVDLVIDHSVSGGPVPLARGLRAQHRVRVPAQRRAILAAPLGPAGLRRTARGAARRRHLSPGEPGASGAGGLDARRRRVPRHARRHRLAHHDDQRARRAGLGRRRHRGRGRDARPADVPAAAGRDRRAHDRRAAGRARPPPTSC